MAWGLLPGALAAVIVAGAVTSVALSVADASHWVTDRITGGLHGTIADLVFILVGVAIVGGTLLLAIYTFTALTLFVGQPFFERISREVDAALGSPASVVEESWWPSTLRGIGEAVRMFGLTLVVAVALFALSLVPVVGTVTSFSLGALFGGWLVAVELTSYAMSRRGIVTLKSRRGRLAEHRALTLGFGSAVFLLFLMPLGAVATMPAAASAATLLTRRLTGETDVVEQMVL